METRITNHLDEYLAAIDDRLRTVLGEMYEALPAEKRQSLRDVFIESVHDIIALAKKGKNVHERFVQNVVLSAVDPIVGFDNQDTIFFWNQGAEETFGYRREDIIGKSFSLLLPEEGNFEEELRMLRERTLRDGAVRDYHTQRRAKDGRILLVSLSRTLLRDEHEQPLGSIAIIRDMTQMKLLERQVAHNEKLALLGQIAAGIAHEIGTPLNIISGIAEVLLLDRPDDHEEREDLETVISQTDRITKLVRDLLSFARPQPIQAKPLHLDDEIRRTVSLLRGRLDKVGVEVRLELDNVPDVVADSNQLQQVFLNLLVNACDAFSDLNDERMRTVRIVTHYRPQEEGDDEVHIHFIDNGPGIRADIVSRIFEPFVTTKEVGSGTGLGLAVCKRIIEDHHGSIDAVTTPGGGTTFSIRFPVNAAGAAR